MNSETWWGPGWLRSYLILLENENIGKWGRESHLEQICLERAQTNVQAGVTFHTALPSNRASCWLMKRKECRKLKSTDDFQTSSLAIILTSSLIPLNFFFFFLLRQELLTRKKWSHLNFIFFNFLGAGWGRGANEQWKDNKRSLEEWEGRLERPKPLPKW